LGIHVLGIDLGLYHSIGTVKLSLGTQGDTDQLGLGGAGLGGQIRLGDATLHCLFLRLTSQGLLAGIESLLFPRHVLNQVVRT